MIKLPCKVGDKVYQKGLKKIYEYTVDSIYCDEYGWFFYAKSNDSRWKFKLKDFGKTVFLTQEDEQALKGAEVKNEISN